MGKKMTAFITIIIIITLSVGVVAIKDRSNKELQAAIEEVEKEAELERLRPENNTPLVFDFKNISDKSLTVRTSITLIAGYKGTDLKYAEKTFKDVEGLYEFHSKDGMLIEMKSLRDLDKLSPKLIQDSFELKAGEEFKEEYFVITDKSYDTKDFEYIIAMTADVLQDDGDWETEYYIDFHVSNGQWDVHRPPGPDGIHLKGPYSYLDK